MVGVDLDISVCVLSYNSQSTIIETLDSILSQDFSSERCNLIVSDDGSKDLTVQVVRDWLAEHSSSFKSFEMISSEKNRGVTENFNRALGSVDSGWVKVIAADDVLAVNCLSVFNRYVHQNPSAQVVFSDAYSFTESLDNTNRLSHPKSLIGKSASDQFSNLLLKSNILAPTGFIKFEVLRDVGFADARFKMMEDYPLWLKLTSLGINLDFVEEPLVYYRFSNTLSQYDSKIGNIEFLECYHDICQLLVWPHLRGIHRLKVLDDKILIRSKIWAINKFHNKKGLSSKLFFLIVNSFRVYKLLEAIISKLRG